MDTELLRSFLEVAHRLHFGQAAEHLGVTQPALSSQIMRLEGSVGAKLFTRSSRRVELTSAGRALLPEAQRLLIDIERIALTCKLASERGRTLLRMASIGAALNSIAPEVVRELRSVDSDLVVQLSQMNTPEQVVALREGRIDLGIVREAGTIEGVGTKTICLEDMMIAMPEAHRLCRLQKLRPQDLKGEQFILWPRAASPVFFSQVEVFCARANFEPRVIMEGNDIETQLGLVAAGLGISPQPASFANLRRVGVEFRQLLNGPQSALQLAWNNARPPDHLSQVIELISLVAARTRGLSSPQPRRNRSHR